MGNGVSVQGCRFDSLSRWYGIPEHLSLAYNNNYLTFNFVGITTHSPQKVEYQYKLEGLDKDWIQAGNVTNVIYNNLDGGNSAELLSKTPGLPIGKSNAMKDAIEALISLGYSPPEASRMVNTVDAADLSSEKIIRAALQTMVK